MSRVINVCRSVLAGMLLPVMSFAADEGAATGGGDLIGLAIGLGIGIAVFGDFLQEHRCLPFDYLND